MKLFFGLIVGFSGTFFTMSGVRDSSNTQTEKSSNQTKTEDNDIVIAVFILIGLGILIAFIFDGAFGFGFGFIIGGVIALATWNSMDKDNQEAFAEFFHPEQKRQIKKERSNGTNRRYNQRRRHEVSEVPPMTDFLRPTLQWAVKRSGVFHRSEVLEAMADYFKLSFTARRERTEEGNMLRYEDRGSRALSHLKKAKLVCSAGHGFYDITEAGEKEAFASNERMTTNYLMRFEAYRKWKEGKNIRGV